MTTSVRISVLLLLVVVFGAFTAESDPLPAFNVRDLSGAAVPADTLSADGRWLLVYVTPGCTPCRALLDVWKGDGAPPVGRVVIVVGRATPSQAAAMRASAPHLQHARWLADSDNEAATALQPGGAPVSIGFLGTESQWTLRGMIGVTRDAIASWLEISGE